MDDGTTPKQRPGGVTGKGFTKNDPRINRAGRPRSFDAWRKLNQQILTELALDRNKNPVVIQVVTVDKDGNRVIKEHFATVAEMIVRQWSLSEKRQQQAIDAAYGKVPQPHEITGKGGEALQIEMLKPSEIAKIISTLIQAEKENGSNAIDSTEDRIASVGETGEDKLPA